MANFTDCTYKCRLITMKPQTEWQPAAVRQRHPLYFRRLVGWWKNSMLSHCEVLVHIFHLVFYQRYLWSQDRDKDRPWTCLTAKTKDIGMLLSWRPTFIWGHSCRSHLAAFRIYSQGRIKLWNRNAEESEKISKAAVQRETNHFRAIVFCKTRKRSVGYTLNISFSVLLISWIKCRTSVKKTLVWLIDLISWW